jgi:hypothetical protein
MASSNVVAEAGMAAEISNANIRAEAGLT